MQPNPNQIMRDLEERAAHLASRNLSYSAFLLMQYYDGVLAEETKEARLKAAKDFLDQSRSSQPSPVG